MFIRGATRVDRSEFSRRYAISRHGARVNAKPLRRAGPKGFRRVIVIEQRSQDLSYITRGERGWDPRGSRVMRSSLACATRDDRAPGARQASRWSPPFQPIIVAAAFVLTETVSGMIEASATRSPAMP
jgi:hypothetical protein